jgi:hypothetical protein
MNEPHRFFGVVPVFMQPSAVFWASIATDAELWALAPFHTHAPPLFFVYNLPRTDETKPH